MSVRSALAGRARKKAEARAPRALDRVQHAADRDPLPARLRRGDGLLGQLDTQVLSDGGLSNSAFFLKRTLMFGAVGLVVMHLVARHGLRLIRRLTPALLVALASSCCCRARRRHDRQRRQPLDRRRLPADPALGAGQGGAGPLRRRHARRASRRGRGRSAGMMPYLLVVGVACLLIVPSPTWARRWSSPSPPPRP